ncbi:PaaI family thioesterase [Streptomyces fulvoviolaceus]|uniref:PaaI family thioesterase n=1 Tax=Streptomyces fulvoviolaceus TaxID=285535 RepID=UPI0021C246A1|nr:PaaI family thioesterase [Streptomyces fulvoviolaceus]MCT9076182.1 PaaI family thioesterase [Streptomyces fulvoviolaceus]
MRRPGLPPGSRRSDDPALGLDTAESERIPQVESWTRSTGPDGEPGDGYGEMIARLRTFLDHVAAARLDTGTVAALADDLGAWCERLSDAAVPEREQVFGHRYDVLGRGQTMAPAFRVHEADRFSVRGTVRFGRYFLGGNGAVHGGAVPLLFDEVLGRLSGSAGRSRARTAYLHTDFRSVTPIGAELDVHGWFVSEEGRKRVLRAEIRHGEVLCAEAEGLFIVLNPGQP